MMASFLNSSIKMYYFMQIRQLLKFLPLLTTALLSIQCAHLKNNITGMETKHADSSLYVTLGGSQRYQIDQPIMIEFKVTNSSPDTLSFCQYDTPFENMVSKFLQVENSKGEEVKYMGPMARRVMPPPAETYHKIVPGGSKTITFDLKKGYPIAKAGKYTIHYIGHTINGLISKKGLSITVIGGK